MKIFFSRHGETEWNVAGRFQGRGNSELTDRGRQQAKCLSTIIESNDIRRIITSPLKRARQTAQLANRGHGLPIILINSLMELHLGEWEGQQLADLEAKEPENYRNYWKDPFRYESRGGETFRQLIDRCQLALEEVARESHGENSLVITHGMSLMGLLHLITGEPLEEIVARPVLPQCSLCETRFENGQYVLLNRGVIDHLEGVKP